MSRDQAPSLDVARFLIPGKFRDICDDERLPVDFGELDLWRQGGHDVGACPRCEVGHDLLGVTYADRGEVAALLDAEDKRAAGGVGER